MIAPFAFLGPDYDDELKEVFTTISEEDVLTERGFPDVFVEDGGDLMASGDKGAEGPWRVGIRDPRGGITDYFARLELTETSVGSSGDYERCMVVDGVRYGHRAGQAASLRAIRAVLAPLRAVP